ncbi:MAG: hypothetical protein ACI9D5_000126 [Candidatus Endobugula sp.]|jgi:hypothetical protein
MRWIFFTILVANIAIFSYLYFVPQGHQPALVSAGTVSALADGAGVAPLVLVSELASKRQPVESIRLKSRGRQVLGSAVAARPTSRSLCTLIGAFSTQSKADYFVERVAAWGVDAKVKNLLVSTTVGFWLHLPPLASRKELLRRLSELQRQGVDSYVIPDGRLANGISLGLFSEETRAKTLKNSIAKLGYQPKIAEVPREKREVWVFLLQGESAKITDEKWSELLSGKDLLQKQQNLCSDVASA